MKSLINAFYFILLGLSLTPALAATYHLPSQASSLPGGFCSQNASDVNCPGNLIFAANDSIIVDSNMRLVISGDFTFGENFAVNTAGQTSALQIIVAGNVNPGNGSTLNANITISGSINSASGTSNTGNMVVSGNLNLGDNSTVSGNITASSVNIGNGVNIAGNISAQNINVGDNTTITGNISTENININGNNTLIDGNINATGTVNNNGTVTGYVNANNVNDNSGGIDDSQQCDIDTPSGPNTGSCPVTASVDHYRLDFSAEGYTCAASTIKVSACTDSSCNSLYPSTSSLNMVASSGSYSQATLNFTGSTQTFLSNNNAATVALGISNANPGAPLKCFNNGVRIACRITFTEGGLTVSWGTEEPQQSIPDQDSQVPLNQPIYISNNTNGACAADLDGKTLMLAVQCVSPASCNNNMLNWEGNTINQPENYINTGIEFDENGKAMIGAGKIRYDDAGKIQLLVKDSAELTTGASNEFVEMPKLKLEYSVKADDPANPLITAGLDFNVFITAVGQEGWVTPNYQPGQLQLKADKLEPVGAGVEGSLVISSATVAGQGSITTSSGYFDFANNLANISAGQSQELQAYYSEVGEISVQVQDRSYWGHTAEHYNSAQIGRFIPAYFSISDNAPKLVEACTTGLFSYTGQRIAMTLDPTITIMPKNALGNNIHNYIGALKKLNTDSADPADIVISELSIFTQMPDIDPQEIVSQSLTGGEIAVAIEQDDEEEDGDPIGVIYQKLATPIVPFDAHLQIDFSEEYLTDTDGVCYQTDYDPATSAGCERYSIENIDGAHLRYGRLVMENTYGPETESLSIPMFTQYYNASGNWVLNNDDSCTPYDSLNAVLDEENSELDPADIPARSGAGTFSAGKPTSLSDSISVASPGEGNQLEFPLLMNQPDYLFFDWDGDGTIQPPSAIITFGQYRGNDRIINWREVFN